MEYNKAILSLIFLHYLLPLAVSEDHGTDNITVSVGHCISCNQTRGLISTGPCLYRFMELIFNYGKPNYILRNISSC